MNYLNLSIINYSFLKLILKLASYNNQNIIINININPFELYFKFKFIFTL